MINQPMTLLRTLIASIALAIIALASPAAAMTPADDRGWGYANCMEDEYGIDGDCIHPDYLNWVDAHRFYNYYITMHPNAYR